jgi:hypothetical protein
MNTVAEPDRLENRTPDVSSVVTTHTAVSKRFDEIEEMIRKRRDAIYYNVTSCGSSCPAKKARIPVLAAGNRQTP